VTNNKAAYEIQLAIMIIFVQLSSTPDYVVVVFGLSAPFSAAVPHQSLTVAACATDFK
jgi:hypothetical protein